MAETGSEMHISQLFPSGRRLIDMWQNMLAEALRVTQTVIAMQRDIGVAPDLPDRHSIDVMDSVLETRRACALLWKEFEIMIDLGTSVADNAVSILNTRTESDNRHPQAIVYADVELLSHISSRLSDRLKRFRSVWKDLVGQVLNSSKEDYALPWSPRSGGMPAFLKSLLGEREDEMEIEHFMRMPDLKHYVRTVDENMRVIEEIFKELANFWKEWRQAEVRVRSARVVADGEWLRQEWGVGDDLRAFKETFHNLLVELSDEPPALMYPVI